MSMISVTYIPPQGEKQPLLIYTDEQHLYKMEKSDVPFVYEDTVTIPSGIITQQMLETCIHYVDRVTQYKLAPAREMWQSFMLAVSAARRIVKNNNTLSYVGYLSAPHRSPSDKRTCLYARRNAISIRLVENNPSIPLGKIYVCATRKSDIPQNLWSRVIKADSLYQYEVWRCS